MWLCVCPSIHICVDIDRSAWHSISVTKQKDELVSFTLSPRQILYNNKTQRYNTSHLNNKIKAYRYNSYKNNNKTHKSHTITRRNKCNRFIRCQVDNLRENFLFCFVTLSYKGISKTNKKKLTFFGISRKSFSVNVSWRNNYI